jgi:hypothetical protein
MSESGDVSLDNDIRVISRKLLKGFVSRDQVAKSLKGLPDVEAQGEYFDPEAEEVEEEVDAPVEIEFGTAELAEA